MGRSLPCVCRFFSTELIASTFEKFPEVLEWVFFVPHTKSIQDLKAGIYMKLCLREMMLLESSA